MLLNQRYQIQRVIGQGGMGKVYLALDLQTNHQVAVKECIASDNNKIERIKREFYFLNKIQHPNIVRALDLFCEKKYFIIMEYLKGLTLNDFIRKHPRSISLKKQLSIMKSICESVKVLNENGIVHRDLKPENIILCGKSLQPKLIDLGIAKAVDGDLQTLTLTGAIIGTPQYMSPEQIDSDMSITHNTDVFALGIMFYQFIAWQDYSPFYGGSAISTMDRILHLDLSPLATGIGSKNVQFRKLSKIIDQAITKNPKDRIASADEMLKMLSQLNIKTPISPHQRTRRIRRTQSPLKAKLFVSLLITMSITIIAIATHQMFLKISLRSGVIRISQNLDTLQDLVDRKLFDAAYELIVKMRKTPNKLNQKKLQLLTLQVQNARGLHREVYNTIKTIKDSEITPSIALEQIQALIHMEKYEHCDKYLPYLRNIDHKYKNKVLSSKVIIYFHQKQYLKVLETYSRNDFAGKGLDVFIGCCYLEIYKALVACEEKMNNLRKTMSLPLRKSKKQQLVKEISQQRKKYKQLLLNGSHNAIHAKSQPDKIGTKTVVLTNAYKILKNTHSKHRNILFYEGYAKTNIFLYQETKTRRYLANAEKYLQKALMLHPQNYHNLILLGQVYSKRKFFQKAYFALNKAIEISNNNIQALDALIQLPIEDARYQEQVFWSVLRSFGNNFKMPKPDLLREDVEKMKQQNTRYYNIWRSNLNNKSEIKQICRLFSTPIKRVQQLAMKMLIIKSCSYPLHKIEEYTSLVVKHLQQTPSQPTNLNNFHKKIYNARKKVIYYQLADFYLHRNKSFINNNFLTDVKSLLLDKKEHILTRYLAAKILVQSNDSLPTKNYNNSKDVDLALVSTCALVEEGLFIPLDVFLSQNIELDTPEKTILYTRLFRIDNKYYELFLRRYLPNYHENIWKNLENKIRKPKNLTKEFLAVASVLWWKTPVNNPHNGAGQILRNAMSGDNKILAAYAHHFYWISPHVYTRSEQYRQQYYGWLQNSNESCQLQMLNSNRFYYRINDDKFFDILEKLAVEGKSAVKLKATYILADQRPYSKQYLRIVNHTSLPNAQRVLAYTSGLIGQLQKLVLNKQKGKYDVEALQETMRQISSLYRQLMENTDNDAFKSFIYKVTAFLGFRSLRQLRDYRYSPALTANILMNLCSDPMLPSSMLPFVSEFLNIAHDSNKLLKKTLSNYEFSPVANIIRSVAAGYSFLGEQAPRIDKEVWKSGFAWGKYRKLRHELMLKETGFYERIHAASSSSYDLYLQKMTKDKNGNEKKPQQLLLCIKQLQTALSFAQEDNFRAKLNYELSILYHTMSNLEKGNSEAQKLLYLAESHIEKSLKKHDLPQEYKIRYELQWAKVKSKTSISVAHAIIEKYLPLTDKPVFLDVMLVALENHSDKKTRYLRREILYKKLLTLSKFRYINDNGSKNNYIEIAQIHLLLQNISKNDDFHQKCREILTTYLKVKK